MADTYSFQVSALPREGEGLFTLINTTDDENYELLELYADVKVLGAQSNQNSCHSAIEKISAYLGGDEKVLYAAQSSAASLSGKITLAVLPNSVTYGSFLRNVEGCVLMQPYGLTTYQGQFYQQASMGPLSRQNMSGLMFSGKGAVCGLVLSPGEGIAYSNNSEQSAMTAGSYLVRRRRRYTVRMTVSGDSYVSDFYLPTPYGGRPLFVIYNESGSGVSCTIDAIEAEIVSETSTGSNPPTYGSIGNPSFTLQRVDSIYNKSVSQTNVRDVITFNPSRSNAVSLTGKIDSYVGDAAGGLWPELSAAGNQLRLSQNNDLPNFLSANTFKAWQNRESFVTVKLFSNNTPTILQCYARRQPIVKINGCPIYMRPKQGISLVATGMPAAGEDITVFGTIRRVPPNATYPSVGDVDNGVQYGPTGTDYTGTLSQPAQADVKSGVSYGAGGTEFTGTYVGSGGGNTYSRGRVVNS